MVQATLDSLVTAAPVVDDYGIYKATQYAFDLIHNTIPEQNQNVPLEVLGLGFFGGFLVTKAAQFASRLLDKKFPGVDTWLMPAIEQGLKWGIPMALIGYAVIDPDGFSYHINSKPMDNLGLLSGYLGGMIAVNQNSKRRKKNINKSTSTTPQ